MTTILRIEASSRDAAAGSVSRSIGDHVEKLLAVQPGTRILRRDLAASPIAHIAQQTIAGYYTRADQMTDELRKATAQSDELIAELKAADVLLLTVPMYNFSIPSALKAWIDQIVRIGHTFTYDGTNFTGLVTGKRAYIACSYGASGYAAGQPFNAANFVEPYLRFLLGFLGFSEITFFSVESTTAEQSVVQANTAAAIASVEAALAAA